MWWARTTSQRAAGVRRRWHAVTAAPGNPQGLVTRCATSATLHRTRATVQADRPAEDLCARCAHALGQCLPACPSCAANAARKGA
jgi:hypothetical protein